MRKIIYTRPDGGLSVVHPVRNTYPRLEELTDAEVEQRAWNRLPADAINPKFVDASSIPSDRTFRDAWKARDGGIDHDIAKAKEIHRNRIRSARDAKFRKLDADWMKAVATGDAATATAAEQKRQALRDAPAFADIDAATTVEELKAAIPPILKA